jgi:hypothetical protein
MASRPVSGLVPIVLAAFAGLSVTAPDARAVTFSDCTTEVAGGITPSLDCVQITDVSNDSEAVMNTPPGAFGLTDWTLIGRDNSDTPDSDAGEYAIFPDANTITGTFTIDAGVYDTYESLALVLKAGASAQPCGIAGYLLPDGTTSGSYSSPFRCPAGTAVQDISHMTLYGSVSEVPLPAAAPLLIGGLSILGLAARRRRAAG